MNQATAPQEERNRQPGAPAIAVMAFRATTFALLCAGTGLAFADDIEASAALRARYLALQAQLASNPFRRPLHLDSRETPGEVAGDVYAVIDSPFESASSALGAPGDWCDILLLHINTKSCRVSSGSAETVLSLWIGAKHDQPLAEASRVNFSYGVRSRTENYLQVGLDAKDGPMSTRDYRIALEAVPLANGQTFIHLAFSYSYGSLGRFAMQAYLGTLGRSKVGFTVVGTRPDGRPRYIGGVRGTVERNTMRYYLALEAYLGALSVSLPSRFEKRIRDWYAASELYPRQLHEVEQGEYLDMKRRENARQRADPA